MASTISTATVTMATVAAVAAIERFFSLLLAEYCVICERVRVTLVKIPRVASQLPEGRRNRDEELANSVPLSFAASPVHRNRYSARGRDSTTPPRDAFVAAGRRSRSVSILHLLLGSLARSAGAVTYRPFIRERVNKLLESRNTERRARWATNDKSLSFTTAANARRTM